VTVKLAARLRLEGEGADLAASAPRVGEYFGCAIALRCFHAASPSFRTMTETGLQVVGVVDGYYMNR
jgi:hypothetical protein